MKIILINLLCYNTLRRLHELIHIGIGSMGEIPPPPPPPPPTSTHPWLNVQINKEHPSLYYAKFSYNYKLYNLSASKVTSLQAISEMCYSIEYLLWYTFFTITATAEHNFFSSLSHKVIPMIRVKNVTTSFFIHTLVN